MTMIKKIYYSFLSNTTTINIYYIREHSKNDLPCNIRIRNEINYSSQKYYWVCATPKLLLSRNNDLPTSINTDTNNLLSYMYGKFNDYYKYNGYGEIKFEDDIFKIDYYFIKGICLKLLKNEVEND